MLELLESYELPIQIKRQTVKRIFEENGSVLALFTGVIVSKEFDTYFEKILASVEEEAAIQGIEVTDENRSMLREMVIATAQIGLYLKAIQEIALAGEGDLTPQLCKLINLKSIKEIMRPSMFKKQTRQLLEVCK